MILLRCPNFEPANNFSSVCWLNFLASFARCTSLSLMFAIEETKTWKFSVIWNMMEKSYSRFSQHKVLICQSWYYFCLLQEKGHLTHWFLSRKLCLKYDDVKSWKVNVLSFLSGNSLYSFSILRIGCSMFLHNQEGDLFGFEHGRNMHVDPFYHLYHLS